MGRPEHTLYRVVDCPADFRACHRILRANGVDAPERLQNPAVIAERDGQPLGFASSLFAYDQLCLGRLQVLQGPHRPRVAMRLFEAYENLLRLYGVSSYLIGIDKDDPTRANLTRAGLLEEPYMKLLQETDERLWYKRLLGEAYG